MKVLAEIPSQASAAPRAGALRRRELEVYGALLERLRGARAVLATGEDGRGSAVAIGLATAAAAAGTRTALLECDLEQPRLAASLGLAAAPGLHEYLRGEAEVEPILDSLVLAGPGAPAAGEPLVCVVAGRPAADGSALLASERFRHALAKLRGAYQLLVLAGPAPGRSGALPLAAAEADAVLACVGPGEPAPELGVPVAGLVVA